MAKFPINVKNKKFMKVVNLIEEDYKSFLEKNLKSESMYFVGTFK